MNVSHQGSEPVFTHSLVHGPAYESYGVDVAKLAGVPTSVVARANVLLKELHKTQSAVVIPDKQNNSLLTEITNIDINNTTPVEAFQILSKLKQKYE